VGAGGTTTGASAHAWLPSVTVTVTTSPSATPAVVSNPFAVVVEGRTSIGVAFTATMTSAADGVADRPSNITIRCGVIESPTSG